MVEGGEFSEDRAFQADERADASAALVRAWGRLGAEGQALFIGALASKYPDVMRVCLQAVGPGVTSG